MKMVIDITNDLQTNLKKLEKEKNELNILIDNLNKQVQLTDLATPLGTLYFKILEW